MSVRGIQQLLLVAQPRNVIFKQGLVLVLRLVDGIDLRRPFAEVDLITLAHAKVLGMDFHLVPFGGDGFIRRAAA